MTGSMSSELWIWVVLQPVFSVESPVSSVEAVSCVDVSSVLEVSSGGAMSAKDGVYSEIKNKTK